MTVDSWKKKKKIRHKMETWSKIHYYSPVSEPVISSSYRNIISDRSLYQQTHCHNSLSTCQLTCWKGERSNTSHRKRKELYHLAFQQTKMQTGWLNLLRAFSKKWHGIGLPFYFVFHYLSEVNFGYSNKSSRGRDIINSCWQGKNHYRSKTHTYTL